MKPNLKVRAKQPEAVVSKQYCLAVANYFGNTLPNKFHIIDLQVNTSHYCVLKNTLIW